MKLTVSGDKLQFDLYELVEEMDDETREEMIAHFSWTSQIWNELKHQICENYAARNMNDRIFELRCALFQSEHAPEALRQTVKSLLDTVKHLQAKERAYSNTLGKWRKWYQERFPAREPVPFPQYDLEWTLDQDVRDFMERNGLAREEAQ